MDYATDTNVQASSERVQYSIWRPHVISRREPTLDVPTLEANIGRDDLFCVEHLTS